MSYNHSLHEFFHYTVFTLQTHHTCLHIVSVHQMAPSLTIVIAAIWLQLATNNCINVCGRKIAIRNKQNISFQHQQLKEYTSCSKLIKTILVGLNINKMSCKTYSPSNGYERHFWVVTTVDSRGVVPKLGVIGGIRGYRNITASAAEIYRKASSCNAFLSTARQIDLRVAMDPS